MSADVVSVANDTTRAAAREAAFKYVDKLQSIAAAMRADPALALRELGRMFHSASYQMRRYAKALDASLHSRVLADSLYRYADMLDEKAKRLITADELEVEAKAEIDFHTRSQ